jgi:exopolyphosphatase/guanosine-5'-triphosphate,3'-diphosphate pyrophosphatase
MRLAAIDLGTVTARLLIADVRDVGDVRDVRDAPSTPSAPSTSGASNTSGAVPRTSHGGRVSSLEAALDASGIREVERHMRITHLGEGLYESGRLSAYAIERERLAFEEFLEAIRAVERRDAQPVRRTRIVATSAVRDAANSEELRAALSEPGLELEVITGAREAELSFLGTLSGFMDGSVLDGKPVLTVDVGGGSTELILGKAATPGGLRAARILRKHSFDIGSRRVVDRFLHGDPPSRAERLGAAAWIADEMRPYFETLSDRPQLMIAVAGTATTAITVRDAIAEYDPCRVHGAVLSAAELDELLDELAHMPLAQRRQRVGLEPARASVILGGLITLRTVLDLAHLDSLMVGETDILQGILLDTLTQQG